MCEKMAGITKAEKTRRALVDRKFKLQEQIDTMRFFNQNTEYKEWEIKEIDEQLESL